MWRSAIALVALAVPARACSVALLLAIDVSNSIDPGEYSIQVDGLAEALRDPEVRDAMVANEVAVAVMQWSGRDRQEITFPWARMRTAADVAALADRAAVMPRAFVMSDTAVGEMMRFAIRQFDEVGDCEKRVVDVSGDGTDNAGTEPAMARVEAEAMGIQFNALAIEGIGVSISNFYARLVITRGGFVMTATGHSTYAETLKRKLRREVSRVMF